MRDGHSINVNTGNIDFAPRHALGAPAAGRGRAEAASEGQRSAAAPLGQDHLVCVQGSIGWRPRTPPTGRPAAIKQLNGI